MSLFVCTFILLAATPFDVDVAEAKATATDKQIRELIATCDSFRNAKDAVAAIQRFQSVYEVPAKSTKVIDDLKKQWQERVDKRLARSGKKWISIEERLEVATEAANLIERADSLIQLNDFEGARGFLEDASQTDPEAYLADYYLGLHFALNRDLDSASDHFKRVIQRCPSHVGALNNLAIIEVRRRKPERAVSYWLQASEIAPWNQELIHNVGRVVYEKGQDRLDVSAGVMNRYRKLYSALAIANAPETNSRSFWLFSPALAPKDHQPQNRDGKDNANLVAGNYLGTGFFVHKNYILTNRHVVVDDEFGVPDAITVEIPSGKNKTRPLSASIVHVSEDAADLAILKCDELELTALPLSPRLPRLGTDVMALGFPEPDITGFGLKATKGTIAALPRPESNVLLFDVLLNPGNSGGPLCDQTGSVVSINSFCYKTLNPVSGGETSITAIQLLNRFVPGFVNIEKNAEKLEWPDIAESAGASVVLIRTSFRDAAPALTEKAGNQKMLAGAYIDPSCLVCNGFGKVPCPNSQCSGGRIPIRYTEERVFGTGTLRRTVQLPMVRYEKCPTCTRDAVRCPHCAGTGTARR